jgi:hypothetical protein
MEVTCPAQDEYSGIDVWNYIIEMILPMKFQQLNLCSFSFFPLNHCCLSFADSFLNVIKIVVSIMFHA